MLRFSDDAPSPTASPEQPGGKTLFTSSGLGFSLPFGCSDPSSPPPGMKPQADGLSGGGGGVAAPSSMIKLIQPTAEPGDALDLGADFTVLNPHASAIARAMENRSTSPPTIKEVEEPAGPGRRPAPGANAAETAPPRGEAAPPRDPGAEAPGASPLGPAAALPTSAPSCLWPAPQGATPRQADMSSRAEQPPPHRAGAELGPQRGAQPARPARLPPPFPKRTAVPPLANLRLGGGVEGAPAGGAFPRGLPTRKLPTFGRPSETQPSSANPLTAGLARGPAELPAQGGGALPAKPAQPAQPTQPAQPAQPAQSVKPVQAAGGVRLPGFGGGLGGGLGGFASAPAATARNPPSALPNKMAGTTPMQPPRSQAERESQYTPPAEHGAPPAPQAAGAAAGGDGGGGGAGGNDDGGGSFQPAPTPPPRPHPSLELTPPTQRSEQLKEQVRARLGPTHPCEPTVWRALPPAQLVPPGAQNPPLQVRVETREQLPALLKMQETLESYRLAFTRMASDVLLQAWDPEFECAP